MVEFRSEGERVLFGEVDVGFVEDDCAASGRAQAAHLGSAIWASAGSVRRSNEAKRRIGPPAGVLKLRRGGDAKGLGERHFVGSGCVNGSERRVKRVAGRKVLNYLLIGIFLGLFHDWFDEGSGCQRQKFVRAVADDDLLDREAVKGSEFAPKRIGGRGRIETQLFADGVADGGKHFGRRSVGIFVSVQFDERRFLRLFARRVRRQETDVGSNQGVARGHGKAVLSADKQVN